MQPEKGPKAKRLRVAAVVEHLAVGLALVDQVLDLFYQLQGLAG